MKEKGITNILSKGVTLKGEINIDGSIHIEGKINGNIIASDLILIGKDGEVHGDLKSKNCIIGGKVIGNVIVENKAEFNKGAQLIGDLRCKFLVIEEGVIFDGNCKMSEKEIKKEVKPTELKK